MHSLSHPHGSRAPNRQFLDSDTNCISPPQSHHGGKLVRTITSIMATRTSNPDHKALTNTTHDDSTKAPALQSLYSLDQDTLNSSLQQSKNNKPDDPVVKRQASFFCHNRNPPATPLSTTNKACGLPLLERQSTQYSEDGIERRPGHGKSMPAVRIACRRETSYSAKSSRTMSFVLLFASSQCFFLRYILCLCQSSYIQEQRNAGCWYQWRSSSRSRLV